MIYYEEPDGIIYQGHALEELKSLKPEGVDCVITSPPYWGLRTYKTEPIIWGDNNCEHEWDFIDKKWHSGTNAGQKQITDKGAFHNDFSSQSGLCLKCHAWKGELGLEPTIELYISHLLQIFDEVKRVLKKTGTLWVNIGDSYASGTCKTNKSQTIAGGNEQDLPLDYSPSRNMPDYPAKSLCLIPERFALGMVDRGWILRNNIIWYKPNPMPESVKDRFTGTYEYLYFFVKNKKYWFEQQFEAAEYAGVGLTKTERVANNAELASGISPSAIKQYGTTSMLGSSLGRNKRDVWEINTQPYPEAHFVVFPEKLVETPILSGCPSAICKKCGKARERIYEYKRIPEKCKRNDAGDETFRNFEGAGWNTETIDKGYSDCGCNAGFEAGIVLDPFAGSGTTGAVAKRLGRKYSGIELSEKYCKLHKKRLQGISLPMELVA